MTGNPRPLPAITAVLLDLAAHIVVRAGMIPACSAAGLHLDCHVNQPTNVHPVCIYCAIGEARRHYATLAPEVPEATTAEAAALARHSVDTLGLHHQSTPAEEDRLYVSDRVHDLARSHFLAAIRRIPDPRGDTTHA